MASYPNCFDGPAEHTTDEPTLEELFAEPIIQLVMKRDGVQVQEMRLQLDRMLATCPA